MNINTAKLIIANEVRDRNLPHPDENCLMSTTQDGGILCTGIDTNGNPLAYLVGNDGSFAVKTAWY